MTPEKRQRFRLLGVFAVEKPITVEAAAAVWGLQDALGEARQALNELVDLSLLEYTGESYRQHSLLREYAYALLEDEGELTGAKWAHAEYYRTLAQQAEMATPKDYPLLDLHMQNLRAALEWTDEHEPSLFAELIEALAQFLSLRAEFDLLKDYLPRAIAAAADQPGRRANLLILRGDLERRLGNIDEARTHYDAALPLYQAERDRLGEANVRLGYGILFTLQQQWKEASVLLEQSLSLYRSERTPLGQASALQALGMCQLALGEQDQGLDMIRQAASLFRSQHDEQAAKGAELLLAASQTQTQPEAREREQLEAFLGVQSPQQMFELVQRYPHMITDDWFALLDGMIAAQTDEQARRYLSERFDTLKQIRQDIEQGAAVASRMADAVIDFANADWNARRNMLADDNTVLLHDEVEPVFDLLLAAYKEPGQQQALKDVRTLLRRCRTWGVDPVFYLELYMRLGDDIDIPETDEATVMQVAALLSQRSEDETALERAIEAMEALLNRLTATVPPLFEAALLRDLAETLSALPAGHPMRRPERIESYYREALPLYRAAERPLSVAFIQRSLGDTLLDQGRYDEALEPLQAAIQGLLAHERPHDAAWALSAFAGALDNLGRIEESLGAYTQAIELLPDMPPLMRNYAEALIHAGKLDEAEAGLARAVELDGNEDSPYLWQRRAQLALARGDGALADRMLDEVLKRDANMDVAFLRAQSAWLLGNTDLAREQLHQAFRAANAGDQAAMRREWQHLATEHPRAPDPLAELP